MKKLLIVISLLISLNSFSQFSFGPAIYFGKSEILNNISTIRSETSYTEYRDSYVAGLSNEYKLNNWFSMQLDILYDQLNSEQFFFTDINDPTRYRYWQFDKLEYLSLPLTMQFQYKKLNLNIGYQTSFLLSNHYEYTKVDQFGTDNLKGQDNDMFINRNISFLSALSYNVYKNINIECRYTRGLSNIMNGQTGFHYDATTSQFLIGLYYMVHIKKKEPETEVEEK